MASYTMISGLKPETDTYVLLVRVTRIWESINKNTKQLMHTNVILLDQEDNHILAILRNNQKETLLPLLSEDSVYTISNVKVVVGPKMYRSVDRDLSINFFYKTKIQKVNNTEIIPHYKFEIKDLETVNNFVGNVKNFVDVIGMVTRYGELETRSSGAQKLDVIISNNREKRMVVTLWEDKAFQFQSSIANVKDNAVFIVITGLIAKKYSETVSLSSSDATKTYVNINYHPLKAIKDAIIASTGETLLPPSVNRFVTAEENTITETTVQQILETRLPDGKDLVRCLCEAKIIEVVDSVGWYYNCCPTCARKVRLVDGKHYCETCPVDILSIKQRYKVIVRVADNSGSTTFTLFNREAEQLIGVPVEKVLSEIKEAQSMLNVPPIINNIVGKLCAFEIKINSYNTDLGYEDYTVTRLAECSIADCSKASSQGEELDLNDKSKKKQKIA